MAFAYKKQKLSQDKSDRFQIKKSHFFSEQNSNTLSYDEGFAYESSELSIFQVQNSMMSNSMNSKLISLKNRNQRSSDKTENILKTEQLVADIDNDIEMRINQWLDSQNVVMVRPEDIIHDFYHKMRALSFQKMELELNEQSSQSSSNDLDYDSLDYSHNKPSKLHRQVLKLQAHFKTYDCPSNHHEFIFGDCSSLKINEMQQNLQYAEQNCQQNTNFISSLLRRRQTENLKSISGIQTNRLCF